MTIAGALFALVVGIAVRQQRVFGDLADGSALEARLREAAALMPVDLRALSPGGGDVRDARDTSLEIRATIATAVVCDTGASRIVLAPAVAPPTTRRSLGSGSDRASYASYSTPVVAGDTAWFLSESDTSERWTPVPIAGIVAAPSGPCVGAAPRLDSLGAATARVALTLATLPGAGLNAVLGAPIRITRPIRYSLYHASDGEWYLGERDWNAASATFNTIQPIAGPFSSAAAGGIRFAFVDTSGVSLASPVVDAARVAGVRIEIRGQTRAMVRALTVGGRTARRTDSLIIAASLRGGR